MVPFWCKIAMLQCPKHKQSKLILPILAGLADHILLFSREIRRHQSVTFSPLPTEHMHDWFNWVCMCMERAGGVAVGQTSVWWQLTGVWPSLVYYVYLKAQKFAHTEFFTTNKKVSVGFEINDELYPTYSLLRYPCLWGTISCTMGFDATLK